MIKGTELGPYWRKSTVFKIGFIALNEPPVTISLVTLYNCFLTVEDYSIYKDTQEISVTQLPYRRCERRVFVIYSSTHSRSAVVLLLSLLFSPLKVSTGRNFKARTLQFFCVWKFIYTSIIPGRLFFSIREFCASSVYFFKNTPKFFTFIFFNFFEN